MTSSARGSSLAYKIERTTPQSPSEVLLSAFEQFREASEKLEQRYDLLRRESEALRVQLREKDITIKRSEKLATLGEAAAAIAHEVRNPLGAMKLFLSLLKDDVADKPESLSLVEQMGRSVDSLENVVSNILHFSANKTIALVPVNLHSIIRDQVSQIIPKQDGGLAVTLSLQGSPFVRGNEHGLRQVFTNLLINSCQALKYKGSIHIAACEIVSRAVEVRVKDSGPGVPRELLSSLFEPFVTSKNEGTGLGLAIVKRIVEEHGGTISVENSGGAEFCITFPGIAPLERK